MPEGDTIFRAARALNRGFAGQPVTRFESVLPGLSRVDYDTPIPGRTIESVTATGKWMLMRFSGDLILLTHMLMSGSWHIYRPGEPWKRRREHMRIVVATHTLLAVAFNVPIAEFQTEAGLLRRRGFNQLGPSVLSNGFEPEKAIARLHSRPDLEVAVALLTQSLVAGLGNVFKSEVCFASRVNPFRLVGSLSEKELASLISNAQEFMHANISDTAGDKIVTYTGFRRTTGRSDGEERLWVYKRRGEPCRVCGTTIEARKQGIDARTSFWCPKCQPYY